MAWSTILSIHANASGTSADWKYGSCTGITRSWSWRLYFSEKTATQDLGSYVMLAGLALQILAMLVYLEVFIELVWRAKKNRAATPFPRSRNVTAKESASHDDVKNVKKWLIATAVSFGLVFVRTCYRIVVLASGSQGERFALDPRFRHTSLRAYI